MNKKKTMVYDRTRRHTTVHEDRLRWPFISAYHRKRPFATVRIRPGKGNGWNKLQAIHLDTVPFLMIILCSHSLIKIFTDVIKTAKLQGDYWPFFNYFWKIIVAFYAICIIFFVYALHNHWWTEYINKVVHSVATCLYCSLLFVYLKNIISFSFFEEKVSVKWKSFFLSLNQQRKGDVCAHETRRALCICWAAIATTFLSSNKR